MVQLTSWRANSSYASWGGSLTPSGPADASVLVQPVFTSTLTLYWLLPEVPPLRHSRGGAHGGGGLGGGGEGGGGDGGGGDGGGGDGGGGEGGGGDGGGGLGGGGDGGGGLGGGGDGASIITRWASRKKCIQDCILCPL